jgi:hypothetical protein
MRLLNASSFELQDFPQGQIPPYAILSHTWGATEEEVIFQDMVDLGKARKKPGFQKIRGCCRQAQRDRFEWVWIDSCCIDKTSSAELSEAINTMFQWYKDAHICYAYLNDVVSSPALVWKMQPSDDFKRSRWFSRGWTLQELIAPHVLYFFNNDWEIIATRASFASILEEITGIPDLVLRGGSISEYCVLEKMSWAQGRITTRIEDIAYCLLGLFEINMPLLYGEGHKAFVRLQEEILKSSGDYSLFAWDDDRPVVENLFASSPSQFRKLFGNKGRVQAMSVEQLSAPPPSIWGRFVKLEMQLGSESEDGFVPAYLNCRLVNQLVCIMVANEIRDGQQTWRRRGGCTLVPHSSQSNFFPKQLCFKIMADATKQPLYDYRYSNFVVSQLPPCMSFLPFNRVNKQPMKKVIGGEEVLVFVHDTADGNDCITLHIMHGPHETARTFRDGPNFNNLPEDLLVNLKKSFQFDSEHINDDTLDDVSEVEILELALSTLGLDSRAPQCDLTRMRSDSTILQTFQLSDRYSSIFGHEFRTHDHFLTIEIKPVPREVFRVEINCCQVDIRNELDFVLQELSLLH